MEGTDARVGSARGLTVLVAIARPQQISDVLPLLASDDRRHLRFVVRHGVEDWDERLESARSRLDRLEHVELVAVEPRRGRAHRIRVLLRLIAAWLVYLRMGQLGSRYEHRQRTRLSRSGSGRIAVRSVVRLAGRPRALRVIEGGIRLLARCIRPSAHVRSDLASVRPDVVLAVGGNMPFLSRTKHDVVADYVDAGRRAGVPTVGLVRSWDNLTTKGTFLPRPDRLLLWGEHQVEDAVARHGFDREDLRVTGSPRFQGFLDAAALAEPADPPGDGPYLLYLGSSANIAPDETPSLREICDLIREQGPSGLRVLVRPHPANYAPFDGFVHPIARVWPDRQRNDLDRSGLATLLACADRSVCAVGINTSGFLDAALLGLPCYSMVEADDDGGRGPSHHLRALIAAGVVSDLGGIDRLPALLARHMGGHERARRPDDPVLRAVLGADDGSAIARVVAELERASADLRAPSTRRWR